MKLLIERQTTRDRVVEHYDSDGALIGWDCIPQPPPGEGWTISNKSKEDQTEWRRPRVDWGSLTFRDPTGDFEWHFDRSRRRYHVRPFHWDDPDPISPDGERITILDRRKKVWWSGLPVLSELTPDGHWEDTDDWAADRIAHEITWRVFKRFIDGEMGDEE